MPNSLVMRYAARSDVGLMRSKNDDSGYAGRHLAVVADGMGGHVGGDIASACTVLDLIHLDRDGYAGDAETQLADEIQTANSLLTEIVHISPKLTGMGTTATALLLAENKLAFAHIGDSRAYRLKNGVFEQISTDHTFVQRLIDEGRLTVDEAEMHPHKNVLMRVLGDVDASPELDITTHDAAAGERWLLCSDGLNFVPVETVEQVVRETASLAATADRLIELTLEAGAPDNVTVVLFELVERGAQDTAKLDTRLLQAEYNKHHTSNTKRATEPLPDTGTIPEVRADAAVAAADPTAPGDGTSKPSRWVEDDDSKADSQTALGEHIIPSAIEAELATREHELVGAAMEAYQEGRIPHVAGRSKHQPTAADALTHGSEVEGEDDVLITHQPHRRSWVSWLVVGIVAVLILVAGWLGYAWTQTQYYVGEANGKVAIYNGVSQTLGPVQLSHVYFETDISMTSLSPFVKSRVQMTLPASSLTDANQIVVDLQRGKVPTDSGESTPAPASPSPTGSTTPSNSSPSAGRHGTWEGAS